MTMRLSCLHFTVHIGQTADRASQQDPVHQKGDQVTWTQRSFRQPMGAEPEQKYDTCGGQELDHGREGCKRFLQRHIQAQ